MQSLRISKLQHVIQYSDFIQQNEYFSRIYFYQFFLNIHWSKQLKGQPVLLLSSFVHNSSINELKNMKLRENACYEKIN